MIYAMFVLFLFTMLIGLIVVKVRVLCVKKGEVAASYFELMQGVEVPDSVIKTTRCLNNLFEVPVLFYVVCTLYIALGIESSFGDIVAWLFVVFRFAQAYIHITYNHVRHRMLTFGMSVLCVFLLWINIAVLIIYQGV